MAFLNVVAHALLWNAHLALLPLIFGIVAYRVHLAQYVTLRILGYASLLPVFWIGATAVGAVMDVGHVGEAEFLLALAISCVEAIAGMLLAIGLFGRFVADAEDFLETTVDMVEAN